MGTVDLEVVRAVQRLTKDVKSANATTVGIIHLDAQGQPNSGAA